MNEEFEKLYEDYKDELNKAGGGLVEANKAEFLKMYAFFTVVDVPAVNAILEAVNKAAKDLKK